MRCEDVRDLLPDRAAGRLGPALAGDVDSHLAVCGECEAELALVGSLWQDRPQVPAGLSARIREAVRADAAVSRPTVSGPLPQSARPAVRTRTFRYFAPVAALAAAAVLVLTVAPDLMFRTSGSDEDPLRAAVETAPSVWLAGDGMVAGAPLLDDLSDISDDDLRSLLAELEG